MKIVALFFASALFTFPAIAADPSTTSKPAATKIDPEREKKELRLVEILKMMQAKTPPPDVEKKKVMDEYMSLLAYFGGFDLNNPPKDPAEAAKAQERAMAAQ